MYLLRLNFCEFKLIKVLSVQFTCYIWLDIRMKAHKYVSYLAINNPDLIYNTNKYILLIYQLIKEYIFHLKTKYIYKKYRCTFSDVRKKFFTSALYVGRCISKKIWCRCTWPTYYEFTSLSIIALFYYVINNILQFIHDVLFCHDYMMSTFGFYIWSVTNQIVYKLKQFTKNK